MGICWYLSVFLQLPFLSFSRCPTFLPLRLWTLFVRVVFLSLGISAVEWWYSGRWGGRWYLMCRLFRRNRRRWCVFSLFCCFFYFFLVNVVKVWEWGWRWLGPAEENSHPERRSTRQKRRKTDTEQTQRRDDNINTTDTITKRKCCDHYTETKYR